MVHGRSGYTVPRPAFHQGLSQNARLEMFELPGIRGQAPYYRDLADIAAAYVAQIQRDYPQGPVPLAAFCTGALIALEMAAQLQSAGREVAGLVLLDPMAPNRLRNRLRSTRQIAADHATGGARLRHALLYGTGPVAQAVGFVEKRLRLLNCLIRDHWLGNLRQKGDFWKYRGAGLRVLPRAWLVVAYRFGWPAPYRGPVHIIASRGRVADFENPDSIWGYLLPERHVEVLAQHHLDIGQANAAEVSARMEEMLLGGR